MQRSTPSCLNRNHHPLLCCRGCRIPPDSRYLCFKHTPSLTDLFGLLRSKGTLDLRATRFAAACIAAGLATLHAQVRARTCDMLVVKARHVVADILTWLVARGFQNILYRSVKPENFVLDDAGYLKFDQFGFTKHRYSGERTFSIAGTPEYVPPEMITCSGHSYGVDWWALGVVTFELLTGKLPFDGEDYVQSMMKAVKSKVHIPDDISGTAAGDFITALLQAKPSSRLGCGEDGASAVLAHPVRGWSVYPAARARLTSLACASCRC